VKPSSFRSPRRSTLPRPWLYVTIHRGYIATMRIYADIERPAPRKLKPAIEVLQRGEVIVYPTDTGYAFGCALSSAKGA
jgi:hypothetical protein